MTSEASGAAQSRAKIFISYSRKDMVFADRLEAALRARGFEPLIDRTDIYAFEDWWTRIEALIARADTVVFVLSPDSAASDVARKEIAFAASLNKRFAPILLRPVSNDAVPDALAKLNFLFFDDEARFDASADRLAEALDTDIGWIRQHTAFGEQARHWVLAKGPRGLLLHSPVLEQAERWIAARPRGAPAPTEETQVFIRASRQDTTRRRNILTGSLAAGLDVALRLAGLDAAVKAYHDSLAIRERVVAVDRGNPLWQAGLSQSHTRVGDALRVQGKLEEALKSYRKGFAIIERLADADPSNTLWQRELTLPHGRIAEVLRTQGQLEEALKIYRKNLAITERLIAADPSNRLWQRDLGVSHIMIGDILELQGKL